MTSSPQVSVILPTFNRQNLVGKSIQSVLDQTYSNFELVIVDDASTDGTEEVVSAFTDSRIIYAKHSENKGGSAARNTGINVAKGEFIAFQDSDDIWLPEKLAKQMAVFEDSPKSVGVVYTQCSRWEGDKKRQIPGDLPKVKNGDIYRTLLLENFIVLPSVVLKKECLEKAGQFDESLPRLQDWDFFLRMAKYFEFRYISEPLVHSFFTEGSISSKPTALIRAFKIILNKHLDEYRKDRNLHADQLLRLARLYRLENDLKTSRKYFIKAVKINHRPSLIFTIIVSFLGINIFNLYWKLLDKRHNLKVIL